MLDAGSRLHSGLIQPPGEIFCTQPILYNRKKIVAEMSIIRAAIKNSFMSDFESIDNSTDDPDYMSEQSVDSSSSDDFVSPQKPRNPTKKKSLMAASKSTPSDSPGASFSLSQVVTVQPQANVVFKKTFDDARPDRFVFITDEGKIVRSKKLALKNRDGFILIFSTSAAWTEFCQETLDPNVSHDKVYQTLSDVPGTSGDTGLFDKLLWTHPDSLKAEIPLDNWYILMDNYVYTNTGLIQIIKKILMEHSGPKVREENSEPTARTGEALPGAIKKPVSSKFNFKLIDEDNSHFIERNMSPATIKANKTATRLFENFMKQCHPELLHNTLETAEESRLPNLIAEFLKVLQKDEDQKYNASSLQSYFLAICRVLKQRRNIVVKNNPLYEQCRCILSRQQKISCDNGQRPGLHKSQAFPPEVLAEAWAKGAFGSSNPKALTAALIIHCGPSFGIRGKEEFADIRVEDFIPGPRRADGVLSNIRYSERKTKTRRGVDGQGARNIEPIMYPDDQRPERCPVRLFDLYQSKKPAEMLNPDSRFFLSCKNTKKNWSNVGVWFTSQPMGKHTLASLVPDQIKAAGIDTQGLKLTGVSVRKTGIDGALSSGMPPSYVACLAGQKTLAAQTHYMSPTDATLKATSRMISNVVNGESSSSRNFNEILVEEKHDEAKRIAAIKTTHETPIDANETSGPVADTLEEITVEKSPPPEVDEDKPKPRHKSRRSKPKKSKKKNRKHHRRSPSTSSSSSFSSSETSSSSEEDTEALKRRLKKEKKRKKLEKENRQPQGMFVPMMMPMPMMSYQGHPNMNANFSVPTAPQSGQQMMSQITQHTVKATSTNANPVFIRDEFN